MHIVTQCPNLSHINPNNGAKNAAIKNTVEVIYPAWTWVKLYEDLKKAVEMLLKGKIPKYVNKQFSEINQKLRLKDLMSLSLTFSVSPSLSFERSTPSLLEAILSITMIQIPLA